MKIFIENLTHSVTNNDLIKLFELSGEVDSITIVNDKISGKPGGFVDMPNRSEALEMINALNGVSLFGTTLVLRPLREPSERRSDDDRRSSADRRQQRAGYAFEDRRISSRRNSELERRETIERRTTAE